MSRPVAVIDIGSNSIKALVAQSNGTPFGLISLYESTHEVRISQGIGGEHPMLRADRIEAGLDAVASLWEDCQSHGPLSASRIVATSAVRSAINGEVFTRAVADNTGQEPIILTGPEEADAIAIGVRTDPAIEEQLDDFTVFDLGGGSLELIRFQSHTVTDRTSLPLGSVRLTERFFRDPAVPIPAAEASALKDYVHACIAATGFRFSQPLVGCSGGLAAIRQIVAKNHGNSSGSTPALLESEYLDGLTARILSQELATRIIRSGLPARRADIFPAALLTFQAILESAGAKSLLHSLHNLRFGIAWQLLHPVPQEKGPANQAETD